MTTTEAWRRTLAALAVAAACSTAAAQSPPKQVVKAPVSQAWIDVATFAGFPMGGGMGAGGGGMMNATLGALMGGGKNAKAEFGNTQTGAPGRWMDVTLYTSRNPNLAEALQGVPEGTTLAPTLKLETPEKPKPAPRMEGEESAPLEYEPPKGKFLLYWGCSETVRPGQPKVLDLETATMAEFGKFMESRRATQRGTHAAAGRPIWPSKTDKRALPSGASLVGPHSFAGNGVPESFKFNIAAAQDLMPEIRLRQADKGNSILLEWDAIPNARAYFLGSMGAREGSGEEVTMVIWTSSELPDSGFGLFDYQTNAAVDKWLKEKVLLPPATTKCAVPKEAASQGMLRAIAYGTEVNMAYPSRPTDPKIAWEPDWNVKIRVKSMSTSMFGMPDSSGMGGADDTGDMTDAPAPSDAAPATEEPKKKKKFNPFDVVKDVVKELP